MRRDIFKSLTFGLTKEEYNHITAAAEKNRMGITTFMRNIALAASDKIAEEK